MLGVIANRIHVRVFSGRIGRTLEGIPLILEPTNDGKQGEHARERHA